MSISAAEDALEDSAAGEPSLAAVRRLAMDKLSIDRGPLGLTEDRDDREIAASIIAMGSGFGRTR